MLERNKKSSAESIPFLVGGKSIILSGIIAEVAIISKIGSVIDSGRINTAQYFSICAGAIALLMLRSEEEKKYREMLALPGDHEVSEEDSFEVVVPTILPTTSPDDMYLYMPPAASSSTDV